MAELDWVAALFSAVLLAALGYLWGSENSGRIPQISAARKQQLIKRTLEEKPPTATHWSRSTMAAARAWARGYSMASTWVNIWVDTTWV